MGKRRGSVGRNGAEAKRGTKMGIGLNIKQKVTASHVIAVTISEMFCQLNHLRLCAVMDFSWFQI